MLGAFIPLVLIVAIVGLIFVGSRNWARRSGFISGEPDEQSPKQRFSSLTEAIAYVGTILVLAGGGAAIGQRWEDITDWGHFGIFAGAALFFLGVGAAARVSREPAFQRLVSVVWFVSAGLVAAATGILAGEVYARSPEVTGLIIGSSVTVYAGLLWLVRRRALQQLALFAGLIATIVGAFQAPPGDASILAIAFALWGFGLTWALLGWGRFVEPMWVAVPVGVILALIAPANPISEHGWMYALGIGTAAAIMAVSVPSRNVVSLALGAVALFGYVTSAVVRYFRDSLGVPAALAITGVIILVLAAVSARLVRAMRPPKPETPQAEAKQEEARKAS